MRERVAVALLALCLTVAIGCAPTPAPSGGPGSATPPESSTPDEWQARLAPVTFDAWVDELSALKGQIVVVDMWATWCLPCIERFPHMVELANEYRGRGVTFVSLCLDDRDDEAALSLAESFLTEQQATFPNFLMDEVVTRAFEKLGLLGIPAVFIYEPAGDLRYRLTGDDPNNQFTDADVEKAIAELLEEIDPGIPAMRAWVSRDVDTWV